jgi:hypothetical protein
MPHKSIHPHRIPAIIALAVAVTGLSLLLLVDHGPWSQLKIQTGKMVYYSTTAEAAKAAGAAVSPTTRKSAIEPVAPGPKPVQPAIPADGKS